MSTWHDYNGKQRAGDADNTHAAAGHADRSLVMRKRKRALRRRAGGALATSRVKRWSAEVARRSNALDLEPGVFTWDDPAAIARSLKRSAEESTRRKAEPFHSAMSMLNFYINRAGTNLSPARRSILQRAKEALRKEFGRA